MSDSRRLVLRELPCMQPKRAACVADALCRRRQKEGWIIRHCADPSTPHEPGALTGEGPVIYDANKTPAFADSTKNPTTVRHILDQPRPRPRLIRLLRLTSTAPIRQIKGKPPGDA